MSYDTIGRMATSQSLGNRISAAAAQEGATGAISMWMMEHVWQVVASPGWAAAWESAEQTLTDNQNPDIGARNDVITDAMILAAVQPIVTAPPETPQLATPIGDS